MDWYLNIILPIATGIISGSMVSIIGVKKGIDYIKEYQLHKEIKAIKEFWYTKKDNNIFNLVFGVEYPENDALGEIEPRFGYAQAYGFGEIPVAIQKAYANTATINLLPQKRDKPIEKRLFDENIILIGGKYSLNKFDGLCLELGVPYYQFHLQPKSRFFQRLKNEFEQDKINSLVDFSNNSIIKDVATIILLCQIR